MKLEIIVLVLLVFLSVFISNAQETGILAIPSEDTPEVYIVKKGDTLWDIAEKFFGDPFTWPDIWNKNIFIEDPHWIYPGQEITLQLLLEKIAEPEIPPEPLKEPEPIFIETAPRTVSEKKVVIDTPTEDNIISFLETPQPTFRKESYIRTGFITKRSGIPKDEIINIEGEINVATRNDFVFVNIGRDSNLEQGSLLAVLDVGDRVKHPDTDEDLGYVVRIKGILEIKSIGDDLLRCMVTESFDPITKNDIVMPIRVRDADDFDAWIRPDRIIKGTILAVNEPLISIHLDDTLYIDIGSMNGVKPGDRFLIYSRDDSDNTEHRNPLGEIQAVNVMPNETAVIVVSMKGEKINIGDRAELSARCRLVVY